ncbi:MAG: hypothetical protein GC168_20405 [Candidatus Hydrogenedens sp.]|nr:hypothetical protein [Candidatus Hydrogenedens sp.]
MIAAALVALASLSVSADWRDVANGSVIHEHGYCDQPYIVVAPDGTWVCVFTTNPGHEGQQRQYVASSRSTDQGQTWSEPVPIEPPDGPEASWAMPLMTYFGRVYAFYDFNGDEVRTLPNGKACRADMLGWYCYRYSDDLGATWSERRRLPVRVTACDRGNDWGGEVQILWGIGKPVKWNGTAWFGFTKLGRYMLEEGEGWFFRSDNILTERDPDQLRWTMLPEGDHGLRAPAFGSTQEEHNLVPLSDGGLYCVYRTTTGHIIESYSHDGGRTWSTPEIARYADGRPIKHPRACPRLWRAANGKFLLWQHNHGGTDFADRNPAWVSGGIERDGRIVWSAPEILLYSHDHSYETGRLSYPDLVEQDGRYWVSVTQKTRATVQEVDGALFEGMWHSLEGEARVPNDGVELSAGEAAAYSSLDQGGFTLVLELELPSLTPAQALFEGGGVRVATTEGGTVGITLSDDEHTATWDTDPGAVMSGGRHTIAFVVDGGPNVILPVVDGVPCDGGETRQYGWGRFPQELAVLPGGTASGAATYYPRALTMAEVIALTR